MAAKHWITGGGLLLGLLVGTWWWRRRRAAAATAGALGLTLPSALTGTKPSATGADLALASGKQVALALAGSALADYQHAEDRQLFFSTAQNDAGAYLKSAYWLAVASRIAHDGSLARAAATRQAKGQALTGAPGGSLKTGGTSSIFTGAAKLVTQAAKGNRQLSAIATILGRFADPNLIAAHAKELEEQSTTGIVKGTVAASAADVGTGASVLRGIFTGELPKGMDPTRWFLLKWGLRIGIVGALGIGGWVYLSPKARQLATAAKSLDAEALARKARAAYAAAKAA